jgi:hypothetical protein
VKSKRVEPFKDSAVCLHEAYELHLAEVLRALKHHVLEEVREACAVARLDAKADVVIGRDGRGRRVRSGESTTRKPFGSL